MRKQTNLALQSLCDKLCFNVEFLCGPQINLRSVTHKHTHTWWLRPPTSRILEYICFSSLISYSYFRCMIFTSTSYPMLLFDVFEVFHWMCDEVIITNMCYMCHSSSLLLISSQAHDHNSIRSENLSKKKNEKIVFLGRIENHPVQEISYA